MKITIIGANGQLGTDLMEIFSSYNTIPLTHSQIEITQFESCLILKDIKPDIIINTAAFHKVDACE
ncbi:MAG TPA: dTDP-4-dehydrorhamnose reductase, partial [Candidatus Desulfofervidus auxilii]|nr:dTDP-4-dehydrorhamnose reductase [Candidatus Desulfofervidus auxilii]